MEAACIMRDDLIRHFSERHRTPLIRLFGISSVRELELEARVDLSTHHPSSLFWWLSKYTASTHFANARLLVNVIHSFAMMSRSHSALVMSEQGCNLCRAHLSAPPPFAWALSENYSAASPKTDAV